jgi:hypothetical protein
MRIVIDQWDPSYVGDPESGAVGDLEESTAPLNLDLEVPAAEWAPISSTEPPALLVHFVDGVRRVDARLWLSDGGVTYAGVAASYAAGVASCGARAEISRATVARGLFTAATDVQDLATRSAGTYRGHLVASDDQDSLSAAIQAQMGALEVVAAIQARADSGDDQDLVVIDGPLRGRDDLPRAIGYVKTHHASYLPADQIRVVEALAAGQRTPVFTFGRQWVRHSWYLRLVTEVEHPWAGIVRCECSSALSADEAVSLADLSAATLPRYSSSAHKDGRAPQNLYPIGGLERHLRHRLGEKDFIYRELRRAVSEI